MDLQRGKEELAYLSYYNRCKRILPVARDIKLKIDLTIVMKFNKKTQKISSRLVLSLEFELLLNCTVYTDKHRINKGF